MANPDQICASLGCPCRVVGLSPFLLVKLNGAIDYRAHTWIRMNKTAAFAGARDRLIIPARNSTGTSLSQNHKSFNYLPKKNNDNIKGDAEFLVYMVLNLASEGEIRPTQAWKMQNSITRTPISCKSKVQGFNIQTTSTNCSIRSDSFSTIYFPCN